MELSREKKEILKAFLSNMGERQQIMLANAMDYARQQKAEDIPYDFILRSLRPSLFKIRPPRNGTAQRIFCNPFEDMLIPNEPNIKDQARISRAVIQPVWNWLKRNGNESFSKRCELYEKLVKSGSKEQQNRAARDLWAEAYNLLKGRVDHAHANHESQRQLIQELGSTRRFEDLLEIIEILSIAGELEELRSKLPVKPITKFKSRDITAVKESYERVAFHLPGQESWLIVAIMRRLLQSADILKVVKLLTPDGDDKIISISDLAKVGNIIISELEHNVQMIRQAGLSNEGDETLLGMVHHYVSSFDMIVTNLNIRREGAWGKRLYETRRQVSDILTGSIVEKAPLRLSKALKQRSVRTGRVKKTVSDLRDDLDDASYREARNAARSMRECLRIAEKIGLVAEVKLIAKKMAEDLENYSEQLLMDIQEVPNEYRERARQHVIMVAHLMEYLIDSDQADLYLRRALLRIDHEA